MSMAQRGNISRMIESTTYSIPLHLESPIQNFSTNTSSSNFGDGSNNMEYDFLSDTQALECHYIHSFKMN